MPLSVLHIDAHLIVIDKPAGLAVHPGPRTPVSLEGQLDTLRFGFARAPRPVHRLDRDTSGCLVLARHPRAHRRLTQLFEAGRIAKLYWAVVDGAPGDDAGRVDAPLAKVSTAADGWRMVVSANGKAAATRWRVLRRAGDRALIAFEPETGRTHQVRVHAAVLGHPILGDPVYGEGSGPLRLHARALTIPYRDDAPALTVTAPLPAGWPLADDASGSSNL